MYTYAFFPSVSSPLALPEGIAASLQVITVESLAALVESGLALEQLQANDDLLIQAVLRHDQIIRTVFEQTPLLPLRFGTYFVSYQGLVEHLQTHQAAYLEKLAQLNGRAEYLLKLTPLPVPEVEISADLKGRDYFLAKREQYQAQTDWQQQQQTELQQVIDTLTQQKIQWVRTDPTEPIERIYLLSDRRQEQQLKATFARWQENFLHWELQLGEALPPYHFV
ncbi:MAG TPA: GvpL/GvpF family gas vesicle protein [Allocoleopsis sp.]